MGFIDRMLTDPHVRARRDEFAWRQDYRDAKADERESRRERQRELDRQQRADAAAVTQRQRENAALVRQYQDQEKAHFGQPRTEYTGGNNTNRKPLRVTHHSAPLPLAFLAHPEAPDKPVTFGPGFMRSRNGSLMSNPEWAQQAKDTLEVWTKVKPRYASTLSKLRDDSWWTQLATAAGLTHSVVTDEPWQGDYTQGTRKVTTITVPTIGKVQVAEDGLRITISLDVHVPPKRWAASVDVLRAGFKGVGADAGNLRVTETASGAPLLIFDDAPSSFPAAVCIEPPSSAIRGRADAVARYDGAAWTLGVDSRGKAIQYPLETFPHALVVGGTGAGKSVWARSVIEMFRTGYRDPATGKDTAGGFTCFVSSGKITDFATLEGLPGVAMVSGDAAQTAVMVRTVRNEANRRYEEAAAAKRSGSTAAFDYPPILLLLDEWGATSLAIEGMFKNPKSFMDDIDWILRVGREARVHVILLSQTIRKTGTGAIPGSWQANLGLSVSLGKPESETFNNPALFTDATRSRAMLLGDRIAGKRGRGMIATGSELTEFQSYYVWSPGTTSLDPAADKKVQPPTDEVRTLWKQWEPISANVPWVMPKLGIQVSGADWATGSDGKKPELDDIADVPVIPLTDRDGNTVPGREQFDPWSDKWAGRANRSRGAAAVLDFTDHHPVQAPAGSPTEPAAGTETSPVAGMTDEERKEAVRQEAIRMGLLPPDEQPNGDAPTPASGRTPREPLGEAPVAEQPETANEPTTPTAPKPPRKPRRGFE